MTSRKGREGVRAELPKETKEALKEADEPMWKVIDESVRMNLGVGGVETEEAFRRRIERLEQEIEDVQSQIEALNNEQSRLEQQKEDEQRRLEQYLSEREDIETIQDRILDDLASTSMSVYAKKSELRELARREYGHETDQNMMKAISDLKDRRTERGLDVPDSQFTENVNSKPAMTDGNDQFKATQEGDDDD